MIARKQAERTTTMALVQGNNAEASRMEVSAVLADEPVPARVAELRAEATEAAHRVRSIDEVLHQLQGKLQQRLRADNAEKAARVLKLKREAWGEIDAATDDLVQATAAFVAKLEAFRESRLKLVACDVAARELRDMGWMSQDEYQASERPKYAIHPSIVTQDRETGAVFPQYRRTPEQEVAALLERVQDAAGQFTTSRHASDFFQRFMVWAEAFQALKNGGTPKAAAPALDFAANDVLNERLVNED
ncbi:MAG: hypothetical protein AB1430_17320 [Pseudomonadota bacterium]